MRCERNKHVKSKIGRISSHEPNRRASLSLQKMPPETKQLATRPDDVVGLLIEPIGKLALIFGEPAVSVLMLAFGISFAGLAVIVQPQLAPPEFLGLLGFAGVLVLAGCAERIAIIRSSRGSSTEVVRPPARKRP
jgi:hypothetical protein